jgi:hypothetical protein
MALQPWDIVDALDLGFYEGNVLKYLLRRKGNRVEDLRKAIHYLERMIELEPSVKVESHSLQWEQPLQSTCAIVRS